MDDTTLDRAGVARSSASRPSRSSTTSRSSATRSDNIPGVAGRRTEDGRQVAAAVPRPRDAQSARRRDSGQDRRAAARVPRGRRPVEGARDDPLRRRAARLRWTISCCAAPDVPRLDERSSDSSSAGCCAGCATRPNAPPAGADRGAREPGPRELGARASRDALRDRGTAPSSSDWLGTSRRRAARRSRHRDHEPRLLARRARRPLARGRARRSGVSAARPPLSRCARAADRDDAVLEHAAPLARERRAESRPPPQVRRARASQNHGIALGGIAHDTMLESYVLNSTATRHDLAAVAATYLGSAGRQVRGRCGQGREANPVRSGRPRRRRRRYAAEDADVALRLHPCFGRRLNSRARARRASTPNRDAAAAVLERMEHTGVMVDAQHAAPPKPGAAPRRWPSTERAAYAAAGGPFNLGSPEAASRSALRAVGAARARQDAERSTVDGRERARRSSPRTTTCRGSCSSTAALQS